MSNKKVINFQEDVMKIKKQVMLAGAILSLVPLLVSVIVLDNMASSSSREALEQAATNQLVSIRETKKIGVVSIADIPNSQYAY